MIAARFIFFALAGAVLGMVLPIAMIVGLLAYVAYLRIAMVPWRGMIGTLAMLGGSVCAGLSRLIL